MDTSATHPATPASETMRQYGRQARDYAGQARGYAMATRDRVRANPLQSAFAAFAAGLLYSKLFHKTRVRVLKMPVPVIPPEVGASLQASGRQAGHLLRRLTHSGRDAAHNLARAQVYGSAAREQIQHHPLAGVALAAGAGGLLVAAAGGLTGNRAASAGLALRHSRPAVEGPFRSEGTIGAHPVAAAALALAAGALLGMLARR